MILLLPQRNLGPKFVFYGSHLLGTAPVLSADQLRTSILPQHRQDVSETHISFFSFSHIFYRTTPNLEFSYYSSTTTIMKILGKCALFLKLAFVDSFLSQKFAQNNIAHHRTQTYFEMKQQNLIEFKVSTASGELASFQDLPSQMMVSSNPNMEAEVFADIAHLALDFATIFAADTIKLRALIFVGRLCSILADYVPDHSMTFDEVVFQTTMLTIAGTKLYKLAVPALSALSTMNEKSSFQDLKIYRSTFQPAGFSYLDYHIISKSFEWVDLHANAALVEEEKDFPSLFLIYQGQVYTTNGETISRQKGNKAIKMIGDLSIARLFQKNQFKMVTQEINFSKPTRMGLTLQAGPNGAKILRIKMRDLLRIVQEDEILIDSTKNLLFNAIEEKLVDGNKTVPHKI